MKIQETRDSFHRNTVGGVLAALADAFEKPGHVVSVGHMRKLYRLLRLFSVNLKSADQISDLFRPNAFRNLVVTAATIDAEIRV